MLFAIDYELVDGSSEGFLYLRGSAGKLDHGAAPAHLDILKSVSQQPTCHFLDIGVGRSELLSKLLGRQPLVVTRRRLVLLVVEQSLQCAFLLRASLEHEQHAVEPQVERRRTA